MDAFRHARESGIFSGDLFEYDSRYLCQENQGNKIKIMSPLLARFCYEVTFVKTKIQIHHQIIQISHRRHTQTPK